KEKSQKSDVEILINEAYKSALENSAQKNYNKVLELLSNAKELN
ncbi:10061_t:CDS:2, partial [Cetraspora pellucida]